MLIFLLYELYIIQYIYHLRGSRNSPSRNALRMDSFENNEDIMVKSRIKLEETFNSIINPFLDF